MFYSITLKVDLAHSISSQWLTVWCKHCSPHLAHVSHCRLRVKNVTKNNAFSRYFSRNWRIKTKQFCLL